VEANPGAPGGASLVEQHRNRDAFAVTADQHTSSVVGRAETDPGEITGAIPGVVSAASKGPHTSTPKWFPMLKRTPSSGTVNRHRRRAAGAPVAGFGLNSEGQGRSSRGGACATVRRAIKGGAGYRHGMRIQDRRPQRTPHRGLIASGQGWATLPLRARVINHTRAAALVRRPEPAVGSAAQ
jgi:hypothetical protein